LGELPAAHPNTKRKRKEKAKLIQIGNPG